MVNKFYVNYLFFIFLLFLNKTVLANQKTIGDLAEIQSETVIYRARKERAQALLELKNITRISGESINSSSNLPVVRNVQGKKPNLYAILIYPGGSEITVKSGDILTNGMIMGQITSKKVTIINSSNGKEFRLGFSSIAPILNQASVEKIHQPH